MQIHFLIVAALKDETSEIKRLLTQSDHETELVVGTVTRWRGLGEYTIGVLDLFGMGTNIAQAATQHALGRYKPRAVLMTGIAAGFQDSQAKVSLGDIMIPYAVVPYELAKVRASAASAVRSPGFRSSVRRILGWRRTSSVEHRGIALGVSGGLWRSAAHMATDSDQPWLKLVSEPRPDGVSAAPQIHAFADSIIGCGEKVIASEEAEVRRWLLECYPRQALGLEMESYGALLACREFDTPFLMVKASVDKATVEKDDRWRMYSCQMSAAFIVTLIERYERPATTLLSRHRDECEEVNRQTAAKLPPHDFQYRFRTAPTFEQLSSHFYDGERHLQDLLPTEATPVVVLYGGGGSGKTTAIRRLFGLAVATDRAPILLDLKAYARRTPGAPHSDAVDTAESIIRVASFPRREAEEIRALAQETRLLLIIDGANEVPAQARRSLLTFSQGLIDSGHCGVLWTTRMSSIDGIPPSTLHVTVENVSVEVARSYFDDTFGKDIFDGLGARLQSIMQRPFFLDLAVRSKWPFSGNRIWSGIFAEFFREHLSLTEADLNALAAATHAAATAGGEMLGIEQVLRQRVPLLADKLRAADVRVVGADGDFEHHLWRDFLLSRALSHDKATWTDTTFDVATTFGASPECLSMVVEQLSPDEKTAFIKTVYDWSYTAALECVAHADPSEEPERRLSDQCRESVVAVVAEKRFDPVPRTATRIGRTLAQYPIASAYLADASRDALAHRVAALQGSEGWFLTWQALYIRGPGSSLGAEDVERVADVDPIVGWTAANLARRGVLAGEGQSRIRAMYREHQHGGGRRSVRWRSVHVLGRWPSNDSVELLGEALGADSYHWVQYGAARSLVEIAARSPGEMGDRAVALLRAFIEQPQGGGPARHIILEEIVEASFLLDAVPTWYSTANSLVDAAARAEKNADRKASLARRASDLQRQLAARGA